MTSTAQPQAREREFGLLLALLISLLLHAVLFVLSVVFASVLDLAAAIEPEPEEPEIRFTFSPPPEEEPDDVELFSTSKPSEAEELRPDGDVPLPQEMTPPRTLPPPSLSPPAPPPQPEVAPQPEQQPEQQPERLEPEELQDDSPTEDERVEEMSDTLPQSADALLRSQERAARSRRPLDLDRSMNDFVRELERYRAQQPKEGSSGPPNNVFTPSVNELQRTGFDGQLFFESTDYDWEDYARQIYWAIWRAWHNRLLFTADEFEKWGLRNSQAFVGHTAQVRFVIQADGSVSGIGVEGPSGCQPLDMSAADALAEVVLPPLPDDFPRDREVVHARFRAIAEIRLLRPHLRRMKALGVF